ncbi:MAG: hypothetical protein EYC62_06730 [Alphaproteobacteria bacterium]|nr:MAG: hypothetical protein EYC62_06730 [Alphaproteobacteria bacterium]
MRDPYTILGVPKNASDDDIKKAYRKLAKKYHPDLNPNNKEVEKKFKELTLANDIIGDPAKRKKFDNGEIDAQGNDRGPFHRGGGFGGGFRRGAGAGAGASGGFDPFRDFDPEDIFSDLFNMGKRKAGAGSTSSGRGGFEEELNRARNRSSAGAAGADVQYTLRITFLEAATGTKRRINLSEDNKTIDVTIPAGTQDGQTLRLKGQGKPGTGNGAAGDAYINVQVDPDPIFEAKGINIFMDLPVTVYEAALGATINVPTIDGKVSLQIPKGSNTDTSLRLKNKGIVDPKTKIRGDQYVRLKVVLPDKIDKDLKEMIEDWAQDNPYTVRKA